MLFRIMEFVCESFGNAELSLERDAALAAKNGGWRVHVCVCEWVCGELRKMVGNS